MMNDVTTPPVMFFSVSAPNPGDQVDEGYTYVIEPSPDWMGCVLNKEGINRLKLEVFPRGFIKWRVSHGLIH